MRLATAIAGAVALCACADNPEPARSRVVPITLEQMLRTYAENPARADSQYRGRIFEFRAPVAAVEKDKEGHTLLEFRSATEPGGASCRGAGAAAAFEHVQVGDSVKMRGKVVGIRSGTSTVVFTGCEIVS